MNSIFAAPVSLRIAVAFLLGAILGAAANKAVVRLAWTPRPEVSAVRRWLVVLFSAIGAALLYWWEVHRTGLLPTAIPGFLLPRLALPLHAQWFCHLVLAWLMLVASLIDADERLIPDEITVPGTMFGVLAATIYPFAMLPVLWEMPDGRPFVGFLHVTSPHPWPAELSGAPSIFSLILAWSLWWLWSVGLMDRVWRSSWGWSWAVRLFCHRLVRSPSTRRLVAQGLVGSLAIVVVWFWGEIAWQGMLTSLIGMAAGGGLIWMVRIIGAATLQREAMGFGDVTLMAMIGSMLGWQSCVVVFFLAPVAGLVLGLLQWILRRDNEIPYGPFLCMAATMLIVGWRPIWAWLELTLSLLGGLVPLFIVACLGLMAALLTILRVVRDAFSRP